MYFLVRKIMPGGAAPVSPPFSPFGQKGGASPQGVGQETY
jgi:hypothetical protein